MEWRTTVSDQSMVKSSKSGWGTIYRHKLDKKPSSFSAQQKKVFPASSDNNTNKKNLPKHQTPLGHISLQLVLLVNGSSLPFLPQWEEKEKLRWKMIISQSTECLRRKWNCLQFHPAPGGGGSPWCGVGGGRATIPATTTCSDPRGHSCCHRWNLQRILLPIYSPWPDLLPIQLRRPRVVDSHQMWTISLNGAAETRVLWVRGSKLEFKLGW